MNDVAGGAPNGGLGVIGLGVMGAAMAERLLGQGLRLTVWNRTRSKCDALVSGGAVAAGSPAEVAARTETVLVSLADQDAVEHALFGPEGVVHGLRSGGVIVDTSTVSPEFARTVAERAAHTGHRALDARILGNVGHARTGELRVMVGGDPEVYRQVEPLLAMLGKEVTHLGESGCAASMKLVLNMLMGVEMQALAEAVVLGERSGLARDVVLKTIAASGFSSPVMRFKCGVMGRRAFTPPDFKLALMRKDMTLAAAEAARLDVPRATIEAARDAFSAAERDGLGDLDCAAVLSYFERLAAADGQAAGTSPVTT
jgi:3-hydroxyisobutyrate dehydrogenase